MNALAVAFRQTLGSLRLVGLLYAFTLGLALLVALPFYGTLKVEDQNSLAFLTLLDGFDYTVYSDFMQQSSRAIRPLLSVGRWLGILYVFLSVYVSGGILYQFAQPRTTGSTSRFNTGVFWQACSHYFGRFGRLFGVTLLFVLVLFGIPAVITVIVLAVLLLTETSLTERGQFLIGLAGFGMAAVLATLVLCIGDYAKVVMFREDERNAFRAFGRAGRLVLGNLSRTYGLYSLLILIGVGLFGLYFLIDGLITMRNWPTIIIMLVVQQALIFARVGLKVWSLGTAYHVYETLPKPAPAVRPTHLAPETSPPANPETGEDPVEPA